MSAGPARPASLLVFTDLDGTLLDHTDYSYTAAEPALAVLRKRGIPLMLATSKTRAEVVELRAELSNAHPFVVENGAAVYIPVGYFERTHAAADPGGASHSEGQSEEELEEIVLGVPYARVREVVVRLRRRFGLEGVLTGFGDLDAQGVAALTGLNVAAAARARLRAGTEPLHVARADVPLDGFLAALAAHGLTSKRGGRFLHVQGPSDKADGVRLLCDRFRERSPGQRFVTAALGDSDNDRGMLQAVDRPIVIAPGRPGAPPLSLGRNDVISPGVSGPAGFRKGIETLLLQTPQ